jgi:putative hydrolase of the HAD superfamily
MLKSLFPKVDWSCIKLLGFDLDGTLYDEFDFIVQVYKPISERLAVACNDNSKDIYTWMVEKWLEKGSSYTYIFDEVLKRYEIKKNQRENIINEILNIFRNYNPQLNLSKRVQYLLDSFKKNFELFLVTDGGANLQAAKFRALGLEKWFYTENVYISGSSRPEYQKPSFRIIEKIKILNRIINPQEVVFFGDRDVDKEFAFNMQFQFVQVYCLTSVV